MQSSFCDKLLFVIKFVIVIFVIVIFVVVFILAIFVLVVFILIVLVLFVIHKNHPTFSNIVYCLQGDYSFYMPNIFLALFAVRFKICSVVVPLISAIFLAVYFIIPE